MTKKSERYQTGMVTRRSVLGDEHVDRSLANITGFDEDFQAFITETAWGSLWSRPHWQPNQRSLVTLALLAARGQWEEFCLHLNATKRTGATEDDLKELILHIAVYAGIPTANHAMKLTKQFIHTEENNYDTKATR